MRTSSLAALVILAAAATSPAQPSTDLSTYSVFAVERITGGYATLQGNVGVSAVGGSYGGVQLNVGGSLVADRIPYVNVVAGTIYANLANPALPAVPFTPPVIADLGAACGMPSPLPPCALGTKVIVQNETVMLPAGTYGALLIMQDADVFLTGGSYTFCSIKLADSSSVLRADGPSTVHVTGNVITVPNAELNHTFPSYPATAADLQLYVGGKGVKLYGRHPHVRICAPAATIKLRSEASGQFFARAVRLLSGLHSIALE